ncbi:MAG: extracellular solute-binding protein [Clostridia bacterium]|nr:extracellular solute-binding protein [Clostridia bacterium]
MKTTKKVLQILLPLVLLLTLLASCGGKEEIPWQKTTAKTSATTKSTPRAETTAATTEATTAETTQTPLPTFNGEEFSIVTVGNRSRENKLEFYNLYNEESELAKELGEAYLELEKRLDTVLSFYQISYEDAVANMSGNKFTHDAIYTQQAYWVSMAINGYIQPLNTDEICSAGFDVENPDTVELYFTQATKELDGKNVWAAHFAGKYFVPYWMDGMRFNKDLVAAAGYPAETLYQLVRDGQWTWDKLEEICRAVTANTDKDGLGIDHRTLMKMVNSMGVTPTRGEDGRWRAPSVEDAIRAATYAEKWSGGAGEISYRLSTLSSSSISNEFDLGRIAFAYSEADELYVYKKVSPSGFGFSVGYLPSPTFEGADSPAYTSVEVNGICIPTSNSELRRTAYALGEIAKIVNSPEGAREFVANILPDEESVEMVMDYIFPGTVFAKDMPVSEVYKLKGRFCMDLFYMHDSVFADLYEIESSAQTYVTELQARLNEFFGY